ncbi:FAD-dependent oxidoreductase, partial [Candidatus Protofrankia californiensis]|uniref:FAD-dependent oxidoreductase n=1 Tax=Candidatus Protofrankia californiensis TaxID=1839754 RepID=UPI001F4A02DA
MTTSERHAYDVIVIGAGGAGLRAALEAHEQGARVAVVCKSLLGKAHTVMAEGGIAAAMGNVWPEDNWQTHFRDTMRGGKMLNQWQMAQIHAQEAPARVWELEEWGAVFDRTPDGRILQRDFGGHRFARLAHVGDRTGLELIRTLQNRLISKRIDVFMECTVLRLLTAPDPAPARPAAPVQVTEPARTGKPGVPSAPGETGEPSTPAHEGRRIAGAFAYWRESGTFVRFDAPAVVLATGGIGKSYQVTSNSWEYTGDGHALALWAGAALMDMEFVQFHPTGMVWPPSVKGILVTEGVRGDGGVLLNSEGRRFMFDY